MRRLWIALLVGVLSILPISAASAAGSVTDYQFAGAVFGLATGPNGSLYVADSGGPSDGAGGGVVELDLRKGTATLVANLQGIADISPVGRGDMFALSGTKLYRISRGGQREIADLLDFETKYNPHPANIDSHPFDVEAVPGGALIAEAGGNDLLFVDAGGHVDWIAVFPDQEVSTANARTMIPCPAPDPFLQPICDDDTMLAEPVATSVAVGPDGAYYVGELKGFPEAPGTSRIWRIEPGARHQQCPSSACQVVADGFTSIVDLAFGPDGTLYVVEMDEASALVWELALFTGTPGPFKGGTINACDPRAWSCTEIGTGLMQPMAVTVGRDGTVYAVTSALFGPQIVNLP